MCRGSTNFASVGPALESGLGVRCPCRRRRVDGAGDPVSYFPLLENAAPRKSVPPTAAPVHLRKSRLPRAASASFLALMETRSCTSAPKGSQIADSALGDLYGPYPRR